MKTLSLKTPFFLAILAFVFGTLFFPSIRILAFAPFLALFFQRKGLFPSLWAGALSGLLIDLLGSNPHFGVFCMIGLMASLIAHQCRKWFYEQSLLSIPLYTVLISFVFALAQLIFLSQYFHPSALLMPFLDGIYAFLWFTCPLQLFNWVGNWRRTYP